jgi:predicted nucleic acid-binding protein
VSVFVVDTSVLVDHLRGDERAIARLQDLVESGAELWSVTVVRTEVLAGAYESERAAIAELFRQLRWLDVTDDLADAAGRIASEYLRSHRSIDTVDYLIAAGARQLEAEVLTMNVRHFPMFSGLRPAY